MRPIFYTKLAIPFHGRIHTIRLTLHPLSLLMPGKNYRNTSGYINSRHHDQTGATGDAETRPH